MTGWQLNVQHSIMGVALHEGLAPRPFFFTVVMGRLMDEVREAFLCCSQRNRGSVVEERPGGRGGSMPWKSQ